MCVAKLVHRNMVRVRFLPFPLSVVAQLQGARLGPPAAPRGAGQVMVAPVHPPIFQLQLPLGAFWRGGVPPPSSGYTSIILPMTRLRSNSYAPSLPTLPFRVAII